MCHCRLIDDRCNFAGRACGHHRMPDVPSVGHSGVRAFLGMPLTVNGQRIGNFCVVDMQPRAWSEVERETVIQLAASTQRELTVRAALSQSRIQADYADALARSKEQLMALIAHDLRRLCLGLVALNIAEDLAIARVALSDVCINCRSKSAPEALARLSTLLCLSAA